MRNYIVVGFVALIMGASTLVGADFWEKKKFSEWSPKEVAKMLSDSPWAKGFSV